MRLEKRDAARLTVSVMEKMREEVRPWLEVTEAATEGGHGQTVLTLSARTLGSLTTGHVLVCADCLMLIII